MDADAASAAMDRYAGGDNAAFGELYDLLAPRLFGFVVRQTRDRARAEDLVQQTFLQMHCARDSYVTGADVMPWAFAIARRLAIDAFRRTKREALDGDGVLEGVAKDLAPDDALRSSRKRNASRSSSSNTMGSRWRKPPRRSGRR
jgi:RNA polymerase sigma-70 factor (ECF subfamily)